MGKATPLNRVKEQFGGKKELVAKIAALVEPKDGESGEAHQRRLRNVSNKKLLHLMALGEKVQSLGGRDAIVKRILELKGQSKDHEYGDKLKRLPLGRVVDVLGGLERGKRERTKPAKPAAAKAEKGAAKTKAKPTKAAPAKKAAAKKATTKTAAGKGAAKGAKTGTRSRAAAR
jgi:hypothetical protein